jgi:N-acetylmuramoyl-L-alanine amidase/putative methionine-R-sulfoxide reductase with GAF domain
MISKPDIETASPLNAGGVPAWPVGDQVPPSAEVPFDSRSPSHLDALQALIAFSALHEQVRRRKMLAVQRVGFDQIIPAAEFEPGELFVLDEVLQLVAERAVAITGADGLAIALAENNEIVLRAAAGVVRPDVGARIDRDSAFSGACFRTAQVVSCHDTETDARVNLAACRRLGARSMVAVPLCGRRRVIGLLEAFSAEPYGFNDSDVRNLTLLAELVLGALRPEDEDRFAESAQIAETKLDAAAIVASAANQIPAAPPSSVETKALQAIPQVSPLELKLDSKAPEVLAAKSEVASTGPIAIESVTPSGAKEAAKVESISAEDEPVAATSAENIRGVFAQTEELQNAQGPRRSRAFLLVACAVVIAAFAAGAWWKLKGSQPAPAATQTETHAPTAGPAAPQPTNANAETSSAAANLSSDADTAEAPASSQDSGKFPQVTGIRHWSSFDSSTVVLDLEDQVQYEAHRLAGPDRIYFDLHDTQLPPELIGKSIEVGDALLNRVRVAQPVSGMTRVVLETKANTNFSVSLEPNPYRLVVEVRKIGAAPKAAVNLFPNADKNKLAIVVPPPTKEDLQLRARAPKMRIVVDAGHGGWDLGTVGRRGLLEKDVVLEIAQRLGKLLETRLGSDVILTRSDDTYIPLDERAEIANQSQADLFISVHANYSDLPSARGVETYYTNTFTTPGAKDLDTRAGAKPATAASLTPADLHDRIEQSRRLAASVQRSMYGTLSAENPGLRDRGIKEAGFVVLTESSMPGILAEVSFVSSPTDEQKLRSDGYREQIAEALYKGIARYAVGSKGVKVASAAK